MMMTMMMMLFFLKSSGPKKFNICVSSCRQLAKSGLFFQSHRKHHFLHKSFSDNTARDLVIETAQDTKMGCKKVKRKAGQTMTKSRFIQTDERNKGITF